MRGTVIGKRPDSIEGVGEGSSLVKDSRVPEPTGCARRTRGATVTGGAPGPLHGITPLDRNRVRREDKATVTDGDRKDRRACNGRAKYPKQTDAEYGCDSMKWRGFHPVPFVFLQHVRHPFLAQSPET